jgi:S1-C subfamily serine protease
MTGAVGSANMWGMPDEPKWKLMRVERVQFGPLFLTNVAVVNLPKDWIGFFEKRAGVPTAGLLGSEALLNYRIGIDYAHSTVYFDIGRLFNFPDFDVIGLILRPEDDGRYTILGIADYDGKPSVPAGQDGVQPGDHLVAVDGIPVLGSTMGQVWSLLGGEPGKPRTLVVERARKQFTVVAMVQHFLGEPDENQVKEKSAKKR